MIPDLAFNVIPAEIGFCILCGREARSGFWLSREPIPPCVFCGKPAVYSQVSSRSALPFLLSGDAHWGGPLRQMVAVCGTHIDLKHTQIQRCAFVCSHDCLLAYDTVYRW